MPFSFVTVFHSETTLCMAGAGEGGRGGGGCGEGEGVVGKKPFLPKANREGDRFLQLARAQMTMQTTQGHLGRGAADPLFLLIKSPSCTES